jgi:hypothetical protein
MGDVSGAVPITRTVTGGGLASGGGDLSANRVITVTPSTQVEAEGGAVDTSAMTPLKTKQAITARQAAEFLSNQPDRLVTPPAIWASAVPVAVADAASWSPNFAGGNSFVWTLAGTGRQLANPASAKPGQTGIIYFKQDATGNRTVTVWGSMYKFPGGTKPTLTVAANALDAISYHVIDATNIACFFSADLK